ncbi:phosphate transport system permease protein [Thioclava sp. ES.031]|uniref:phosphate ABC transporter permease PstA n=1 Tax=Thioclava TaxID=285107 RepID=UPI000BF63D6F|nr:MULTISPECIES: phosphate ABC transporter permease PstA [Thioclava]MAQ38949.1 phosphate ABC transporter, permease protein PstA [Thioclava sp.]PFG64270.1 phosphate transport system permease protein [Thioclava sp. ES.031]|tara:strand:+ start:2113 stop:2952 length:840 start_codon:yes stop_codon:yes gene_type:complete
MASMTRRKTVNAVMMTLSTGAAALGLFVLAVILLYLLYKGASALNLSVFTQDTPSPMEPGGLRNAILGSVIMSVIAVAIGTPIGILAGTYMAEYGRYAKLSKVIRFVNDILLSAPSIIVGLFVYQVLVVSLGHFSALAGSVALAILVIPIVVRTTEDMLRLVPDQLREAGLAMGWPRWIVIRTVAYKAAMAGIVTGVLLAIARISGETAPLLFTALSNNFFSLDLTQPMASLPITIFQFALSPYDNWQALAWAGALLITVAVLALSIVARLVTSKKEKH